MTEADRLKEREGEVLKAISETRSELMADQLLLIQVVSSGEALYDDLVFNYNDGLARLEGLTEQLDRISSKIRAGFKL